MATDRADELTDYHNQGQADGNTGSYNPPHGTIETALVEDWVAEKWTEENDAYDKGWNNVE